MHTIAVGTTTALAFILAAGLIILTANMNEKHKLADNKATRWAKKWVPISMMFCLLRAVIWGVCYSNEAMQAYDRLSLACAIVCSLAIWQMAPWSKPVTSAGPVNAPPPEHEDNPVWLMKVSRRAEELGRDN